MIKIEKFLLTIGDNVLDLPPGGNAQPLTVQRRRGCITLWVLLDDTVPTVKRHIVVVLSGVGLTENFFERNCYIGTVTEDYGDSFDRVWHVFEVPR